MLTAKNFFSSKILISPPLGSCRLGRPHHSPPSPSPGNVAPLSLSLSISQVLHWVSSATVVSFSVCRRSSTARLTLADFYHVPSSPHSSTRLSFIELTFVVSLSFSPHPSLLHYADVRLSPSLSLTHSLSQSRFMTCPKCNAYVHTCKYIRRTYSHAALQDAPKINPTQAINSFWTKGSWK